MERRRTRLTGIEKGILGISRLIKTYFYHDGKFDYFRLVLTIALFYLLYALILLGYQRFLYAVEIHKTHQFIHSLEKEQEKLRLGIEYLNTPLGLEQTVREKLGYVKPGETAIQLVDKEK